MNFPSRVEHDATRQNLYNSIIKQKDFMKKEKSSESKAKNMVNIPSGIEPYNRRKGLTNDGMLINRVNQTKNS